MLDESWADYNNIFLVCRAGVIAVRGLPTMGLPTIGLSTVNLSTMALPSLSSLSSPVDRYLQATPSNAGAKRTLPVILPLCHARSGILYTRVNHSGTARTHEPERALVKETYHSEPLFLLVFWQSEARENAKRHCCYTEIG